MLKPNSVASIALRWPIRSLDGTKVEVSWNLKIDGSQIRFKLHAESGATAIKNTSVFKSINILLLLKENMIVPGKA
jgi:hypothetical protein